MPFINYITEAAKIANDIIVILLGRCGVTERFYTHHDDYESIDMDSFATVWQNNAN